MGLKVKNAHILQSKVGQFSINKNKAEEDWSIKRTSINTRLWNDKETYDCHDIEACIVFLDQNFDDVSETVSAGKVDRREADLQKRKKKIENDFFLR